MCIFSDSRSTKLQTSHHSFYCMVEMPGYWPTLPALDYQKSPYLVDTDDYKVGIVLFAPVVVKRGCTTFESILRSTWGLLSPGKQVGRSSTPCWKRSQVWGRESDRRPKYMQQRRQCWKWQEF